MLMIIETLETIKTIKKFHNNDYDDYRILEYASIVLSLNQQLQKSGVHAIVLLSHVNNQNTSD
jgi:hypothetical protein